MEGHQLDQVRRELRYVRRIAEQLHVAFAAEYHKLLHEIIKIEEKIDQWKQDDDELLNGLLNGLSQSDAFQLNQAL